MELQIPDDLIKFGVPKKYKLYSPNGSNQFFECFCRSLNNLNLTRNCSPQQLRFDCKTVAKEYYKSDKSKLYKIFKQRTVYQNILRYFHQIELSPNEAQDFNVTPIQILPEIEGYFLCKRYDITLNLIVFDRKTGNYRSKIIGTSTKKNISYDDKKTIHIVQRGPTDFQVILHHQDIEETNSSAKNRPGTINHGNEYEHGITAFLAIRCAFNNDIEDFDLKTNLENYGSLDDIVLEVTLAGNEKHLLLFQLKYKNSKKETFKSAFENKNGIFNLDNFETDFFKITNSFKKYENIKIILFTNSKISNIKSSTKTENENSNLITSLINTKENTENIYQITEKQSHCDKNFLSKIIVCADQINVHQIKPFLKTEIETYLGQIGDGIDLTSIDKILNYFTKWSLNSSNNPITKSNVKKLLLDILLNPYLNINIPTQTPASFNNVVKTFIQFNLAIISNENEGLLMGEIINYVKKEFNLNIDFSSAPISDEEKALINNPIFECHKSHFEILSKMNGMLTKKDLYLILCRMKKIPIVLQYTEQNNKKIDTILSKFEGILKERTIVLVTENSDNLKDNRPNVFHNLFQLKTFDADLYKECLKCIKFNFLNDKSLCLQDIISFENDINIITKTIDPNVFLKLTCQEFGFKQDIKICRYYVNRSVKYPVLKQTVITDNPQDQFVLINHSHSEFDHFNVIKSNENFVEVEKMCLSIYKHSNKAVHILQPIKDNLLQWVCTIGPINKITKYQFKTLDFTSNNIASLFSHNRIQAICSNSGMGKTTLLRKYAQEIQEDNDCFPIFINLIEHSSLLEWENDLVNINNVLKVVDRSINVNIQKFVQTLFQCLLKIGKITLLIDGYDEIDTNKIKSFLNFIKNTKSKILIASRASKRKEIVDFFNILCIDLAPFSKTDQINFFMNYFHKQYSKEMIEEKLNSLSSIDGTLIGIPLQTQLCAYLFEENKNIENVQFSTASLFTKFLNNIYKKVEDKEYENRVSKLSITLFFDQELRESVGIYETELQDMITAFKISNKKDFIISGFNDKNEPLFTHKSYAEFLCANWLVKKLRSIERYKKMYRKFFCRELTQIRMLFDKIVCENFELHSAVLNDDFEKIVNLLKAKSNLLDERDDFGRTALHLAVSYGKTVNIQTEEELKGLKNRGQFIPFSSNDYNYYIDINENTEEGLIINDKIVKYLLDKGAKNIRDNLLEEFPIGYCILSGALENADLLCKKYNEKLNVTKKPLPLLLYSSFTNNFSNLFGSILANDISYITTKKYNGENLLFSVVSQGKSEIFQKIIDSGVNVEEEIDGKTVLEVAIEKDHLNIVIILSKSGINLLKKNSKGKNALMLAKEMKRKEIQTYLKDCQNNFHSAASNGNLNKCKEYVESGIFVDSVNEIGNTPFMLAVEHGHWEVAEYLFLSGADLTKKNENGKTGLHLTVEKRHKHNFLLHYAVYLGNIPLLEKILSFGLDVDNMYKNLSSSTHDWKKIQLVTPLQLAVTTGNLQVIDLLLKRKPNLEKSDSDGQTLLHHATLSNNIKVLNKIIGLYSGINNEDKMKKTPLHIAAEFGKLNSLHFLIGQADRKKTSMYKRNLLHYACLSDNIEVLEAVLNLGFDINSEDDFNVTPLHMAAEFGKMQSFNFLINKGADLKKTNIDGQNILHFACKSNSIELLTLLSSEFDINCEDRLKQTPLHIAAQFGKLNSLNFLLGKGANYEKVNNIQQSLLHYAIQSDSIEVLSKIPNLTSSIDCDDIYKRTPLHLAAELGNLTSLNFLIQKGADYTKLDWNNQNVIHFAAKSNNIQVLTKVCSLGLNIDSEDHCKRTPLHIAAEDGTLNSLNFLIENKARIRKLDNYKQSVLHKACNCKLDNVEILKKLIDLNLDIDSEDDCGKTPLHVSTEVGNSDCFNFLLEHGADYNKVDILKQNLLHLAVQSHKDNTVILEKILKLNIDVNDRNVKDETPLDIAYNFDNKNVIEILKKHGATGKENIKD